jgi:hypothetical protein
MQGVSQGQQRAYGAEANKTASRIQLYMTLALFLWIMREQWQMVPIILCCVTALQHKCSFVSNLMLAPLSPAWSAACRRPARGHNAGFPWSAVVQPKVFDLHAQYAAGVQVCVVLSCSRPAVPSLT